MDDRLVVELAAFAANRERLLVESPLKYALVHGEDIIATYDTQGDAIAEGYRRFGNVPFLVKQVVPVERPASFFSHIVL